MDSVEAIMSGSAAIAGRIYGYWKRQNNQSSAPKEKKTQMIEWYNISFAVKEEEMLREMIYILERDNSMLSYFQSDLENYSNKHLRIILIDKKPILLNFSEGEENTSPKNITDYANKAQEIVNRQKVINKSGNNVIELIKRMYAKLNYLQSDLECAQTILIEISDQILLSKVPKNFCMNPKDIAEKVLPEIEVQQ